MVKNCALLCAFGTERRASAAAGSGSGDWVGRGRGSLLLFPRPPTEPCGTVSVLHGSPVGTIHRFRITGITPPSPAIVLHLWPLPKPGCRHPDSATKPDVTL